MFNFEKRDFFELEGTRPQRFLAPKAGLGRWQFSLFQQGIPRLAGGALASPFQLPVATVLAAPLTLQCLRHRRLPRLQGAE